MVFSSFIIWLGFLACAIYRSWTPFKEHSQHQLRACRDFSFESLFSVGFCENLTLHSANMFSLFSPALRWGRENENIIKKDGMSLLLLELALIYTHWCSIDHWEIPYITTKSAIKLSMFAGVCRPSIRCICKQRNSYKDLFANYLIIQAQPEYRSRFNAVSDMMLVRWFSNCIELMVPSITGASWHR